MREYKFFAKTVDLRKNHHSGLPVLVTISQDNEYIEIVLGDSQAKLVEPEIMEPCA